MNSKKKKKGEREKRGKSHPGKKRTEEKIYKSREFEISHDVRQATRQCGVLDLGLLPACAAAAGILVALHEGRWIRRVAVVGAVRRIPTTAATGTSSSVCRASHSSAAIGAATATRASTPRVAGWASASARATARSATTLATTRVVVGVGAPATGSTAAERVEGTAAAEISATARHTAARSVAITEPLSACGTKKGEKKTH